MEVLTTAEMERADRLTIAAGTPGFALMLSAGQEVAAAARDLVDEGPILVIAGPGNNGGDGFVAAAELAAQGGAQGREVSVILMCERDALKGDAASAARGWKYPVLPFNPQAIGKPALIIDALFGAGLSRIVEGEARAMIEAINANGAPVLAVDLPSGVNGTTAAIMGAAVRATETITFFRKKPAHLLLPGRLQCGRVRVADIGIGPKVLDEIKPQCFENLPQVWRQSFPVPQIASHKYARGHVLAVSGDVAATGAVRMAARAALRAGAGLVTLASPRDALTHGIATVYQDLAMIPLMSVTRNFFMGSEPTVGRGIFRRFDVRRATQIVREEMANIVVDNIEALLGGRMPPNCVNPQVLGK